MWEEVLPEKWGSTGTTKRTRNMQMPRSATTIPTPPNPKIMTKKKTAPLVEEVPAHIRCQGWVRHGGVFTLGPVEWRQCKEPGVVELTVKEEGKKEQRKLPACINCWRQTMVQEGIKIISVVPMETDCERL
jgi:hypothetical protein